MRTLRIDHVLVATPDADHAAATFQSHFGLPSTTSLSGSPALQIGDARIAFVTPAVGTPLAAVLARAGEGLAEVRLEVASLDDAEAALRQAGVGFTVETGTSGRMLAVDPGAAHGVRLTLVAGSAR